MNQIQKDTHHIKMKKTMLDFEPEIHPKHKKYFMKAVLIASAIVIILFISTIFFLNFIAQNSDKQGNDEVIHTMWIKCG